MKNEIKNNDNCTKRAYVPARVKVIELTVQKVLCVSGSPSSVNNPWGGSEEEEW